MLVSPSSLVFAACSQMVPPPRNTSDWQRIKEWLASALEAELGRSRGFLEHRFGTMIVQTALALDEKYGAIIGKVHALDGDVVEVQAAIANMQKMMDELNGVVAHVKSQIAALHSRIADLHETPRVRVDIDLARLLDSPLSPSISIDLSPEEWKEIVMTLDYSAAGSPEKEAESPPPPMAHQPGFSGGAVSATGSPTVYASLSAPSAHAPVGTRAPRHNM